MLGAESCSLPSDDRHACKMLSKVFLVIQTGDAEFTKRFVHHTSARTVVAVISTLKPWDHTKFLTHLCLSLGSYSIEMELFYSGNIAQAFVNAGLLPSVSGITRVDLLQLLKVYRTCRTCLAIQYQHDSSGDISRQQWTHWKMSLYGVWLVTTLHVYRKLFSRIKRPNSC